jgi:hypothetical protein
VTDLRYLAARYRLGLLDSEALVHIAEALLQEKRDTPAVIQLSILESPIMTDAGPLFERVCSESGVAVPSREEAIEELIRSHLNPIASGGCRPRDGLEAFMREIYYPYFAGKPCERYVGDSRGMQHLIGDYWSYDDLLERPHEVSCGGKFGAAAIVCWEELVRQHARDWLEKHGE